MQLAKSGSENAKTASAATARIIVAYRNSIGENKHQRNK